MVKTVNLPKPWIMMPDIEMEFCFALCIRYSLVFILYVYIYIKFVSIYESNNVKWWMSLFLQFFRMYRMSSWTNHSWLFSRDSSGVLCEIAQSCWSIFPELMSSRCWTVSPGKWLNWPPYNTQILQGKGILSIQPNSVWWIKNLSLSSLKYFHGPYFSQSTTTT